MVRIIQGDDVTGSHRDLNLFIANDNAFQQNILKSSENLYGNVGILSNSCLETNREV